MTGTYFLWWWDPGHCVGELVVIGGVIGGDGYLFFVVVGSGALCCHEKKFRRQTKSSSNLPNTAFLPIKNLPRIVCILIGLCSIKVK